MAAKKANSLKSINKKASSFKKSVVSKFNNNRRLFILGIFALFIIALLVLNLNLFVAATVNGVPISRLKVVNTLETQWGSQALDSLVTRELLMQKASKDKVVVEESEVDLQIAQIEEELKAQGGDLASALALQGQTLESLREGIEFQLLVEKMLMDMVEVSDEEIENYYEENQDFFEEDTLLDDVKEDIRLQLEQQKLQEAYTSLITSLRNEASIKEFVSY